MAVWTNKFVVRDEDWLREIWTRLAPLRQSYGCIRARIFRHATEADTYFTFYEFQTMEGARGYIQAAEFEANGGLANFAEKAYHYEFYDGDAIV